ncbi:uncharacterized protein GGS22DRAFT_189423 [Annulohypoxylon maeteangense]|uniref:uncharacterized protein n=1 Tax=Annulohypoxylon maeteangense TaxID=1927788 RepID=UPI0020080D65|nr:uncharacterized protein GGS22DRAFT_189423 [Annulohypoxylon maeteangense]KAI0884296.1 hypothetical protein GGS22DRAFT_189423 [Annulohypoxylon maeteangense]
MAEPSNGKGLVGRVRGASISLINTNPQLGMWQAAGTVIAQAPNLTELRLPEEAGGIDFNSQGHSAITAVREPDGELVPVRTATRLSPQATAELGPVPEVGEPGAPRPKRRQTLLEKVSDEPKKPWGPTIVNGLKAFWKFFCTPAGFCIIIYFLNIVAWGAMLFFLLLKAAPAMNYPTADDDNLPRKKWLEIDSQILNALFCVTGFGLAPWRFRDLYFFIRASCCHDKVAMGKLSVQNKGWFRPPLWAREDEDCPTEAVQEDGRRSIGSMEKQATTFTGNLAPPTALWKLAFTIIMMVFNTLFQVALSYFMWAYNRLDRPTWATGTFIGLGCGVSALAGGMSWWEGRKVKKTEGPELKIIDQV